MNYHKTLVVSLLIGALSLGACNTAPQDNDNAETGQSDSEDTEQVAPPESPEPSPTSTPTPSDDVAVSPPDDSESAQESSPQTSLADNLPQVATIEDTQMGDLMCYVTVTDLEGDTSTIGANFKLCNDSDQLIGRTLGLGYTETPVADCESSEPCGRTRQELLLSDVINLGESWSILSDGNWRVMVGKIETWDGVNNTGDLTYYGCDDENNCLALEGGVVSCRRGVCGYSWDHGDYLYSIATPIVEDGDAPSTLRVFHDGEEILNIPDMEVVNSKTDPS